MSSSESEDLPLPIDFWDQRLQVWLGINAVEDPQCSLQTSGRKPWNDEVNNVPKFHEQNRNTTEKLSVSDRTKQQKRHWQVPTSLPSAEEVRATEDGQLYQRKDGYSPDEGSPIKQPIRKMKRKRRQIGPVIYSDSDSNENEECSLPAQFSPSASHRTNADVSLLESPVANLDKSTSRSPNFPPFLAKQSLSPIHRKVTRGKGNSHDNIISGQALPSARTKLFEKVGEDRRCGGDDAKLAQTVTSMNTSSREEGRSDNSADELDASQMETLYDCEKLKISRSRFGAFRRKNYKFAPLIFAEDSQHKSTIFAAKWSKSASSGQNTKCQTSPEKGILSKKTTAESRHEKSSSERSDTKISGKGVQLPIGLIASEEESPSKSESTLQGTKKTSRKVGRSLEGVKQTSGRGVAGTGSLSPIKDFTGGHPEHDQASNPNKRRSLPSTKQNIADESTISEQTAAAKLIESKKITFRSSDKDSCESGNSQSPQKRRIYAAMNEIFFGDGNEKIKPAPTKRRILESDGVIEVAKEQNANEVTLLDDDSLWISSRK